MNDRLIANIIYKELFSYNVIFLKDLGYISLVSYSASLSVDGSVLLPPYKTIALYNLNEDIQNYVDLVASISQATQTEYGEAESMFDEFISSHKIGNTLNIPMVMTINLDDMSIMRLDENIVNALEGQDMENIRLLPPPSHNDVIVHERKYKLSSAPGTFQMIVASLIAVSALLYIVYYFFVIPL